MRPFIAIGLFFTAVPVLAEPNLVHYVGNKDNYTNLALFYYGRANLALHLKAYNRRHLYPGIQIVVPSSYHAVWPHHQTLEQFAQEHLHDAGRAEYLQILHRRQVKPGMYLKISPSLRHIVTPTDTWRSLAQQYYGDTTEATQDMIRAFNPTVHSLKPAQALRIPLDLPEMERETIMKRIAPLRKSEHPPASTSPALPCSNDLVDQALERFARGDLWGADMLLAKAEDCLLGDLRSAAIVSRQRGVIRALLAQDSMPRSKIFYENMSEAIAAFWRARRRDPNIDLGNARPSELVGLAYDCALNLIKLEHLPQLLWPCPLADWGAVTK